MWISVKEYIVEERNFEIKNANCASNQVVLQLLRRDVRASFFLFPKKVVQVICTDTDKKIKKSQWSPEIVATSRAMKDNHKIPTWGFWTAGILLIGLLIAIPVGIYLEIKDAETYKASYMGMDSKEKQRLRLSLEKGDLIRTMQNVYMIKNIENDSVVLVTSKNKPETKNFTDALKNEDYPEASFTGKELKVSKSGFKNGIISSSDVILNILDN